MARGRKGGRPTVITKEKIEMAKTLHKNNKISIGEILKQLKVSRRTFYSMLKM